VKNGFRYADFDETYNLCTLLWTSPAQNCIHIEQKCVKGRQNSTLLV